MKEKTLREHLQDAARARWAKASAEERKAHSAKMNAARWPKKQTT